MSLHVVARRCPRCAGRLQGEAGRVWLSCESCPVVFDADTRRTLLAFRPLDPSPALAVRLPFYLFADDPRAAHWVPAFHCFQQQSRQGAGAALDACGYRPDLVEAPLGALLARGPEQAAELARTGLVSASLGTRPADVRLVSLGCVIESDMLREPVSGWNVLHGLIRPLLLSPA